MAPTATFDHLRDADLDDDEFDEDEVDIQDLREKFEVAIDQGYDCFVVVDGLPPVDEAQKPKLVKFVTRKLNAVGVVKDFTMPMGDDGMSLGYVVVFCPTKHPSLALT